MQWRRRASADTDCDTSDATCSDDDIEMSDFCLPAATAASRAASAGAAAGALSVAATSKQATRERPLRWAAVASRSRLTTTLATLKAEAGAASGVGGTEMAAAMPDAAPSCHGIVAGAAAAAVAAGLAQEAAYWPPPPPFEERRGWRGNGFAGSNDGFASAGSWNQSKGADELPHLLACKHHLAVSSRAPLQAQLPNRRGLHRSRRQQPAGACSEVGSLFFSRRPSSSQRCYLRCR